MIKIEQKVVIKILDQRWFEDHHLFFRLSCEGYDLDDMRLGKIGSNLVVRRDDFCEDVICSLNQPLEVINQKINEYIEDADTVIEYWYTDDSLEEWIEKHCTEEEEY